MNAKTAGGLFLLQDLLYRRRDALGLSLGRFFYYAKSGGEQFKRPAAFGVPVKAPKREYPTTIVHCRAINKKVDKSTRWGVFCV